MKFLIVFCTLDASASVNVGGVEPSQGSCVTITFTNEKTGHNFPVKTSTDHKVHHIHNFFHGPPGGSTSMMAASAQLTGTLTRTPPA
ncbi:hypothetical protein N7486_010769 [Penicillium sp. IBT 16267x]|nr:hypothetical protein N7486_010769 [Penicillium sp. IBT 16267x]